MNSDDIRRALSPDDDWQAPTPAQLAAEFTATPYRIQPDAPRIGGMGAVYRALDTGDKDAQVAIKIIRPHLLGRDSFFERFQREETILRSLDHPNIVRLRDSGETPDGTRYIVMDWVEGRSLRHLTQPRSEENIHILLPIYRDLCAAVAHAHASGIFHRDLKPDNIIVTPANRAILLDLGIARPLQRDPANPTITIPGESPGTLGYQPPEVWRDGQKPDHTADIYALGLILYELLMKRPADAASLRPSEKGMSADLDAIFRKAAAPEKKERYQSAAELLGAVERVISTSPTASPMNTVTLDITDSGLCVNGEMMVGKPFLGDLIRLFGGEFRREEDDHFVCYIWDNLGIAVSLDDREPNKVRFIALYLGELRAREAWDIRGLFAGKFAICAIPVTSQSLLENLKREKPGRPFRDIYRNLPHEICMRSASNSARDGGTSIDINKGKPFETVRYVEVEFGDADKQNSVRQKTESEGELPLHQVRLPCGCAVHRFALRCKNHDTPNTWPKKVRLMAVALGLLGAYGFLFGSRDHTQLSLLAIVASIVAQAALGIAAKWYDPKR